MTLVSTPHCPDQETLLQGRVPDVPGKLLVGLLTVCFDLNTIHRPDTPIVVYPGVAFESRAVCFEPT